jgi:hypothetical protein
MGAKWVSENFLRSPNEDDIYPRKIYKKGVYAGLQLQDVILSNLT